MPYIIDGYEFRTKDDIKTRCREILGGVPDGKLISDNEYSFLVDLFQYHDEWQEKTGGCCFEITTGRTASGTRCFFIIGADGTKIDISFPHAVRQIPSLRSSKKLPQYLLDYKNAARTAIRKQISSFRQQALASSPYCPISHMRLTLENSEVDHVAPLTFDKLLYGFTKTHGIDPSNISVGSLEGTVACFDDDVLSENWASYHKEHACLRLISKAEHRKVRPPRINWECICRM